MADINNRQTTESISVVLVSIESVSSGRLVVKTSKCMHGMNQTGAEYSRHGKKSQRASLSQIGPVVLEV